MSVKLRRSLMCLYVFVFNIFLTSVESMAQSKNISQTYFNISSLSILIVCFAFRKLRRQTYPLQMTAVANQLCSR